MSADDLVAARYGQEYLGYTGTDMHTNCQHFIHGVLQYPQQWVMKIDTKVFMYILRAVGWSKPRRTAVDMLTHDTECGRSKTRGTWELAPNIGHADSIDISFKNRKDKISLFFHLDPILLYQNLFFFFPLLLNVCQVLFLINADCPWPELHCTCAIHDSAGDFFTHTTILTAQSN